MTQRASPLARNLDWKMEERQMLRYLLGELKPSEKERFEESYFADDSVYAVLCGVEDELVDSYLSGRLAWRAKRRFESYYLASPTRVAKVEEGRQLMRAVLPASSNHLRFWPALWSFLQTQGRLTQFVALGACMVVALGGTWLVEHSVRLQGEVDYALQALKQHQGGGLAASSPSMPGAGLLTVVLMPGMLKGESQAPDRTTVPGAAEAIRAELMIDAGNGYQVFRAALRTPEGAELWKQTGLKRRRVEARDGVILILSSDLLTGTDYIIQLEGSSNGGKTFVPLSSYWLGVKR